MADHLFYTAVCFSVFHRGPPLCFLQLSGLLWSTDVRPCVFHSCPLYRFQLMSAPLFSTAVRFIVFHRCPPLCFPHLSASLFSTRVRPFVFYSLFHGCPPLFSTAVCFTVFHRCPPPCSLQLPRSLCSTAIRPFDFHSRPLYRSQLMSALLFSTAAGVCEIHTEVGAWPSKSPARTFHTAEQQPNWQV